MDNAPRDKRKKRKGNMTDFSTSGWIALFGNHQANVEGWDLVTRKALVVDPEQGILRPVTDYPDFQRLIYAHKVVSAIPATPGYRVLWRDPLAGVETEAIVGWLVTERGGAVPITANGAPAEEAELILEPGQEVPPPDA
ncbi:hypothetical protein [Salinispora arenicola]|uniref:hypothetical protein n=1 Tax=Salinispora arenicola TaxID=168697 RepID=UPI0012BCD3B2|nr:hypothetical protein [Salinispora arenicola]